MGMMMAGMKTSDLAILGAYDAVGKVMKTVD